MRALILGAGAVGSYVGGRLAAAGHAVTFLARPNAAQVLRTSGLHLKLGNASPANTIRRLAAASSPAEALAGAPYDFIVLAVKSFDTAAALADLQAATASWRSTPREVEDAKRTQRGGAGLPPILCLQNGVDNEAEITRALGADRVIAGIVTSALSKPAEGEIVVERERGVGVALGHALSAKIVEALMGAGFKVRAYPAAGPMKWSKLITNLVGNAASAILDMRVAELMGDRRLFDMEARALRECLAVMRALGYAVVDLPGVPVRGLALVVERLPRALAQALLRRGAGAGRGGKPPSLHMDLINGRPQTEVGWLNGAVARHGAERGVPTPVNQALTDTLEALVAGQLSRGEFRRKPDALLRLING